MSCPSLELTGLAQVAVPVAAHNQQVNVGQTSGAKVSSPCYESNVAMLSHTRGVVRASVAHQCRQELRASAPASPESRLNHETAPKAVVRGTPALRQLDLLQTVGHTRGCYKYGGATTGMINANAHRDPDTRDVLQMLY